MFRTAAHRVVTYLIFATIVVVVLIFLYRDKSSTIEWDYGSIKCKGMTMLVTIHLLDEKYDPAEVRKLLELGREKCQQQYK